MRSVRVGDYAKERKRRRYDADFFPDLPDERLGQRLVRLHMAAGKAPPAGIGAAMRTAPGQQDLAVSHEQSIDDIAHSRTSQSLREAP